jgi:PKD repeat protein
VGTYVVTLTVTDDDGATNSTTRSITVTSAVTANGVAPLPPTGSAPFTTEFFDAYTVLGLGPTSSTYAWDFGDGSTGSGSSPTHTFATEGTYYVTLTVTDTLGGTHNYAKNVVVGPYIAPGVTVDLTPTSLTSGPSTSDPGILTVGERWYVQAHAYDWVYPDPPPPSPGGGTISFTFRVSLADEAVIGPPDKFYGLQQSLENGTFEGWVEFTEISEDVITRTESGGFAEYTVESPYGSYYGGGEGPFLLNIYWRFSGVAAADGGPADITNRLDTTYVDITGTSNTAQLTVGTPPNSPPTAAFSYTPTTGVGPLTVSFTDESTDPDGGIASWFWDFGIGSTTAVNPNFTFEAPGTYTVTLTVTDLDGAEDSVSQDVIVTEVPPPTITCTVTPLYPNGNTAPAVVAASVSVDPPETVAESAVIDWGDGSVPELVLAPLEADIPHTYSTSGIYQVLVDLYESPDGPNG